MTALLVREVQSQADVAAFMAAGKRAQSGNSRWIEPLHDEMLKVFDKKRSPLSLISMASRPGGSWRWSTGRISKNTAIPADILA
jgi:hypothetical protein